jgi:hypothetical protein
MPNTAVYLMVGVSEKRLFRLDLVVLDAFQDIFNEASSRFSSNVYRRRRLRAISFNGWEKLNPLFCDDHFSLVG